VRILNFYARGSFLGHWIKDDVLILGHIDIKVRTWSQLDSSGGMRTSINDKLIEKWTRKNSGRPSMSLSKT
jgi:hypothetical protein